MGHRRLDVMRQRGVCVQYPLGRRTWPCEWGRRGQSVGRLVLAFRVLFCELLSRCLRDVSSEAELLLMGVVVTCHDDAVCSLIMMASALEMMRRKI